MNKKIWLMNHYAITPNMGGITRHFDLAEELVKRGYEVTVFASSFDHKLRVETLNAGEKFREEIVNGVRFVWIRTTAYKKNDIKRVMNMITYATRVYRIGGKMEAPDVIVASSFHPLTSISGYFLTKKNKAKYIAEIRDLWPQSAIDMGAISENGIPAKVLKKVEKFIYTRAEKIIVLLPKAVDYVRDTGIDESKIAYIPNGVVMERYDEAVNNAEITDEVKAIISKHENKFKALYLGAMGPSYALENIIRAAEIIKEKGYKDIDILMVGDGTEKERLKAYCADRGIDNMHFYNPIKKYGVPVLLSLIDLCLFNLKDMKVFRFGISPNKLFDYLYSAKPIIFACECSNDIVAEADAGISIPPEKPEEFAEAVIQAYNMTVEQRKILGENGRKYIKEHHDIPVLVDKLEKLF
jgi:glycosyltransferase involved in cell wall biosynthesis